jgi:glutamate N-acetyltransferase / amino-acid N-acetyltransferase
VNYEILEAGHVCSPLGWQAGVAAAGIKYADRDDIALLLSQHPCSAAAIFTTNLVKAAPLLYDQALLARNPAGLRAVVINSGNANACTGPAGAAAVQSAVDAVVAAAAVPADSVFVMSTGVIGVPMPLERLRAGIAQAAGQPAAEQGLAAARAIMTTDTRPKCAARRVHLVENAVITIGGMAKGAGMIHPNMATMLGVITTDATIAPELLDRALRRAADRSFNAISVDGDTSTNDTLLILANGAAAAPPIADLDSPAGQLFSAALESLCVYLAQEVVRDGEGATRFVSINVAGAGSAAAARRAAHSVARSPLVKTALFGADPNWGRVLCALGYSGVEFDPARVTLSFGGIAAYAGGVALPFDEDAAYQQLSQPEVVIDIDLGNGTGSATVWTCDFSYDYVKINADYRT